MQGALMLNEENSSKLELDIKQILMKAFLNP
jgi:hypothetical protein